MKSILFVFVFIVVVFIAVDVVFWGTFDMTVEREKYFDVLNACLSTAMASNRRILFRNRGDMFF